MAKLRLAVPEDFDFFYELKCEESNIYWTGHGEKPNREKLYLFFIGAIWHAHKKESRKIFIIEDSGVPVGHLYLIPEWETGSFELAPGISEKYRGKGYARQAIALGLEKGREYGLFKLYTSIREDNVASLKAFTACGAKILKDYRMVYIPKLDKEVKMFFVEKELN